jgi:hypothetical protein
MNSPTEQKSPCANTGGDSQKNLQTSCIPERFDLEIAGIKANVVVEVLAAALAKKFTAWRDE